jgi:hypothetical protein
VERWLVRGPIRGGCARGGVRARFDKTVGQLGFTWNHEPRRKSDPSVGLAPGATRTQHGANVAASRSDDN